MLNARCAWDWQHYWRATKQPCDCYLRGCGLVSVGQPFEDTAWLGQLSGRQREPGNECDVVLRTIVNHVLSSAVADVVLVLNTGHSHDLLCAFNLRDRHFGEADLADLAFVLHLFELAEGFFGRDLEIDALQLVEIDALDFQATQAHLNALVKIFPTANG